MGVESPGHPHLFNRGIQQTIADSYVHADGNSELGGAFYLRAVIGMKAEKNFTSHLLPKKCDLSMRW